MCSLGWPNTCGGSVTPKRCFFFAGDCPLDFKPETLPQFSLFDGQVDPIHGRITNDVHWILARFNGLATIGFTVFFAALMIGGESASRRLGVPTFYVLVLVGLLLLFLALTELLDQRWRQRTKVAG